MAASGQAPRWPEGCLHRQGNAAPFAGHNWPHCAMETRFKHGPNDKQYLARGQQRHQLGCHGASLPYNAVDPSLVRPHTNGFGIPEHVRATSPYKVSSWLAPAAHPGHAFQRAGVKGLDESRLGETQAEQISILTTRGGLRLSHSTSGKSLLTTDKLSQVPSWVSRLSPDCRRSEAGRTQAELILFLEKGGGLRTPTLAKSMSQAENVSVAETAPQYLKTARSTTAPVFGHRLAAKACHLSSPASPPRFPRIRTQEDHWGIYSQRVFKKPGLGFSLSKSLSSTSISS